jgi:hypothetical protein
MRKNSTLMKTRNHLVTVINHGTLRFFGHVQY